MLLRHGMGDAMNARNALTDAREEASGDIGKLDRCVHFFDVSNGGEDTTSAQASSFGGGAQGKPGDHNHERWSYGLPAPRFARPRNDEYAITQIGGPEARMVPFFVQIKCQLGKSYDVANKLADAEIASEIYSTAGDFDLLVKFYVDPS